LWEKNMLTVLNSTYTISNIHETAVKLFLSPLGGRALGFVVCGGV
jgi:hypothetical protein